MIRTKRVNNHHRLPWNRAPQFIREARIRSLLTLIDDPIYVSQLLRNFRLTLEHGYSALCKREEELR